MFSKIIGHQVEERARSPLIWNYLFNALNIDGVMQRQNVEQGELSAEISNFLNTPDYQSILLAAPLKESAVRILSHHGINISGNLQSINLIFKTNDGVCATSTDGHGALASIGKLREKSTYLILGYGGTSKSIVNALIDSRDFSRILIATRKSNLRKIEEMSIQFLDYNEIHKYVGGADVIINATTLGNSDNLDKSPFHQEIFSQVRIQTKLLDVNYNETGSTPFLSYAKEFGINGIDGKLMNLMQAIYAFKVSNPKISKTLNELVDIWETQSV